MALHLYRYRTELRALEYMLEDVYKRIDVMSISDIETDSAIVLELMYTAKHYYNRCDELHRKTKNTLNMVSYCPVRPSMV
jgi:hypothetical protein